jgi:hypothetical protein
MKLPTATPDLKPELPIHIDSTMLTHFRSCPRRFFNEFCLGLRTSDVSIHLHAGGCFAHAIENTRRNFYDEGLSPDLALARAFPDFVSEWGDYETDEREKKNFFNVWRGVCSYFENWPLDTDHIKPYKGRNDISTYEYSFAIPLPIDHPSGVPFIFCGRIDLLGEYLGKPVCVDEKTSSSLGASFADKWRMRGQFLGYCWALKQIGLEVDTAVIRGTSFAVNDIKHLEVIQPYSRKLIDRWYDETLRTLEEIVNSWNRNHYRLDFGDACTAFNRPCDFTILCTAPDREETWYPDFKVRKWNPLMKNPLDPRKEETPLSELVGTAPSSGRSTTSTGNAVPLSPVTSESK